MQEEIRWHPSAGIVSEVIKASSQRAPGGPWEQTFQLRSPQGRRISSLLEICKPNRPAARPPPLGVPCRL